MTREELSEEWRKRVQNLMKREEVDIVRCKNCDYCSFALIKDAE